MAKFFLLDHSLTQVGGHHFDYMRLIAEAIESAGFQPLMATNKRFQTSESLSRLGPVFPVFRNTVYSRYSLLAGLREITRVARPQPVPRRMGGVAGRWQSWCERHASRRSLRYRTSMIRKFAEDCERFFATQVLNDEDQAFFVTMSELDFMGLAAFLSNHPRTLQLTWHVQFHFNSLYGRPPEYDEQESVEQQIRDCFQTALARVPYHDIKCYTTSDELADQYNRLGLIPFEPLPYPVNPKLLPAAHEPPHQRPLNISIAGSVRREKGQELYLARLIEQLWDRQLSTGKLRLNVQCQRRNWLKRKKLVPLSIKRTAAPAQLDAAIKFIDHPLDEPDYLKLIDRSDIGLMFYDARRYYSRRAGVLGEFLAAGKPVIVPAGCWLAEQIAEASFQHVEHLVRTEAPISQLGIADTQWTPTNVPLPGDVISFDRHRHPFTCRWKNTDNYRAVAVQFAWRWPHRRGDFCRLDLSCWDALGNPLGHQARVVGHRRTGGKPAVLFNLPPLTDRLSLSFKNAYLNRSLNVADVSLQMFPESNSESTPLPVSAVGVTAADVGQLSAAVEEIIMHYDHYLASANEFAQSWSATHDPVHTVDCLTESRLTARHVA